MTDEVTLTARRPFGFEGQRYVAYWWFVGWWALSLGAHVSLKHRNLEVHLPFGFFRVGRNADARK